MSRASCFAGFRTVMPRAALLRAALPSLACLFCYAAWNSNVLIGRAQSAEAGTANDHTVAAVDPLQRVVFTQVPVRDAPTARAASMWAGTSVPADGSRIVLFNHADPNGALLNLTPGFSAAGRADVSFDGHRILFVGRRAAADPFAVWEVNVDGSGLRKVTSPSGNCTQAIYLSQIYTLDADEPAQLIALVAPSSEGGEPAIHTCHLDGARTTRITFNPAGASDPYLLSDGRLLFSYWLDGAEASALFTVNTDGTDLFPFAGVHQPPAVRGMPCETPDGWVVYTESTGGGWPSGGTLVQVPRTRSLRIRREISTQSAALCRATAALPDGRLLVSIRTGDDAPYRLGVLRRGADSELSQLYASPAWHALDAKLVAARPQPPGRSSVVSEKSATGLLYCLDTYLTGTHRAGDSGAAQVARVQLLKAVVQNRQQTPSAAVETLLLGEAAVEADGSFYLEVPARTPFRLQTLNAGGEVVQAMHSWMWVMPREGRGCIGCHEDRELTPPNRHVHALRKPPHRIGVAADAAEPASGHRPRRKHGP